MASHDGFRWDANDTFFIQQQLQHYDPRERYHLVPGVVGRKFIPLIDNVSPNMPSYRYTMTRIVGDTKRTARGRNSDSRTVKVVKEEVIHAIHPFEEVATWTIDEVRAAREAGTSLDMATMLAAQTTIEQKIDAALCSGVAGTSATGLANNAAVPVTNAVAAWSGATNDQILGDVRNAITDATSALKQAQIPGGDGRMFDQFILWLPLSRYQYIDMTPRSTTSDTTILDLIKRYSAIKAVIPWWRLDTAGPSNAAEAILTPALDNGAMNPMAGGALLPSLFESLPEQYAGRSVLTHCSGKCGGVAIPYPVAFRYLRGL
jgi:hypothetical protein